MQRFQAFFVARCLCHRPPWLRPCEVNGVQRLQDFGAHVLLSNLQITWKLATGVKESATKRSLQNPSKIRSLIVPLGSCHFPAWKSESVFCLSWKFYPKILVIQSQEWLLPWELTWNLKITQLKRRLIWNLNLKTFIFALHFCGFPSWNHHPFLSPTESPKATSLKPPLVVRHKLLKKRVGSGCKSQNSNPEKHGWQCHNVCTPDITRLHDVSVLLLYVKWLRLKLPASYGYNIAQCLSIAARLGSFRLFKAL